MTWWVCQHLQDSRPVAADGDLHEVGVLLLWAYLADDRGVGDIFTYVGWGVLVVDKK